MHIPYEKRLNRPPDFWVRYRFYEADESGRQRLPYQGYRSDFLYEHPAHAGTNQIFMIWPEFLDERLNVISEDDKVVPVSGNASMWIISNERRDYHRDKIEVGLILRKYWKAYADNHLYFREDFGKSTFEKINQ